MRVSKARFTLVAISVLLLSIMPLGSSVLSYLRPAWVLLFLLYLQYTLPKSFGVGVVLSLGLMLDALGVGLLGEHAFALVLTLMIASNYAERFRLFPMIEQMVGVLLLTGFYEGALALIQYVLGYPVIFWAMFLPAMISALAWPCCQYFGDRIFFTSISEANR